MVHGGGPEINSWLTKVGIEPKFKNGLRVTDGMSRRLSWRCWLPLVWLLPMAAIALAAVLSCRSWCPDARGRGPPFDAS
eukprot:365631-Chlamydomonas_euryale.AAC.4